MEKKHIIFYHGDNCLDGAMAMAFFREDLIKNGVKAEDIVAFPLSHNNSDKALETIKNTIEKYKEKYKNQEIEIDFLDFFPTNQRTTKVIYDALREKGNTLIKIRDHHVTAHNTLEDMISSKSKPVNIRIDSVFSSPAAKKSAALMVYEETHPDEPVPKWVIYVSRADLSILESQEGHITAAFFDSLDKSTPEKAIAVYEMLTSLSEAEMLEKGKAIYDRLVISTNKIMSKSRDYSIEYKGKKINVPVMELFTDMPEIGRVGTQTIRGHFQKTGHDFVLISRPNPANEQEMRVTVLVCKKEDPLATQPNAAEIAKSLAVNYLGIDAEIKAGGREDQAVFTITNMGYRQMLECPVHSFTQLVQNKRAREPASSYR